MLEGWSMELKVPIQTLSTFRLFFHFKDFFFSQLLWWGGGFHLTFDLCFINFSSKSVCTIILQACLSTKSLNFSFPNPFPFLFTSFLFYLPLSSLVAPFLFFLLLIIYSSSHSSSVYEFPLKK